MPIWHWRDADREVMKVKRRYGLENAEIHTAWLLRRYLEQSRIDGFDSLSHSERRSKVEQARNAHLLQLQKDNKQKAYKQNKKNYAHTKSYIHLSLRERATFVEEIACCVSNWGFARLFAECIDKIYFDPARTKKSVSEQAFEQIISRFEKYLQTIDGKQEQKNYGIIVHDNNETVARKHTQLMRHFHSQGTLWTNVDRIIETPLFVDSQLTSMVQIADLCAYSLRRYLENGETQLFEKVFKRADRFFDRVVGVRHFNDERCKCMVCRAH